MAQMVKKLPAMQETRVWSLGPEDPLEEGWATDSSILIWRIPRTEEPGVSSPWGLRESDMAEWLTRSLSLNKKEDRSSCPLRRQETESQASLVKPNIQHQWYLVWAPESEITAAWLRAHGFSIHFRDGVAGVPLSVGYEQNEKRLLTEQLSRWWRCQANHRAPSRRRRCVSLSDGRERALKAQKGVRDLKSMLLSERNHPENATYGMIASLRHPGKGKTWRR